nr:hypothetical protein [Tanacetum cinerariifolium]
MADLPPPNHVAEFPKDEPIHPAPAPIILHHAPAQPEGYVGDDDIEEDKEEDPDEGMEEEPIEQDDEELKEDKVGDDDTEELEEDGVGDDDGEEMEIDDEDNDGNNDEDDTETEFAPPVLPIADANDELIPPVIQFGGNYHIGKSSSTGTLVVGNGWVKAHGLMRMAKKFKEDEFHMKGHEYDITALDTVEPPIHPASAPRADDPYAMVRDAAITAREDDDDDTTAPRDSQPSKPRGSPCAVELCRWFKKTKSIFRISECARRSKVKFVVATLLGRALTWWNTQVTTLGLVVANEKRWADMRKMMMEEFCPIEEIQRLENELRSLKLRYTNIAAYTQRFNELALLFPEAVPTEKKKVELYIKGLLENIKGKKFPLGPQVLFDLGSDKSLVYTSFSHLINIEPVRQNTSYEVDLADIRVVSTNTVLKGCVLKLVDHLFEINLMPIELGTFDIVIGMDWLVERNAIIVCGKKEVHIPVKNEVLVVKSNGGVFRFKVISCIKVRKYMEKGSQLFLAHVMEKEPKEKHLEDEPVIRDFLEVFPDDLSRLTPPRVIKEGIYTPEIVTLGSPNVIRKEKGRIFLYVHQLPGVKQVDGRKTSQSLPSKPDRVTMNFRRWGTLEDHSRTTKKGEIAAPTTPTEVRKFLGLAGYYQRFIEGSLISKPLTKLTQKNKKYEWGTDEEEAFQLLKQKVCCAPILALPEGSKEFIVYCDVSLKGFGAVLMQREKCWVVVAAKLLILNPYEFALWKMRIEQYFLMTDYSLWEVILNGNSTTPTRLVDRVVQSVAPTTAEQRLAKKNELKARGTLLMDFPDKHQLNFNIHKDAKSLMKAIEKRFGGNKETKKVNHSLKKYQFEILEKLAIRVENSHSDLEEQGRSKRPNINESVSAVSSVSATSTKPPASILPNVDNLSDAEMDLKWQMAILTMRARRFLQRTRRNLEDNGTTSIWFDMSKVECYNFHRRGHFARECMSHKDTRNKETQRKFVLVETSTSNAMVSQCDGVGFDSEVALCSKACFKAYATLQSHYDKLTIDFKKSQFDVLSYKTGLESVEARLEVYQQNENVFEEDIKLLKLDVMLRDNALEELRKKFEKAKKERDELKLTLAKFQTSLKNLNESVPTSPVHDRYKSGEGYHAVPPPYTGAFMPLKPDLVFHDAYTISETVLTVFNVGPDESKGEPMPTQKVPSFVQTFKHVKNPRTSVQPVEHPTLAKNLRKYTPKSRGHRHSWNRKAGFVCNSLNHLIKDCDYYKKKMVQKHQALKDERVIDSGCSRHIIGSISYLSEFEEINGGYVAFGGNPKSGKIIGKDTECVVLSCDFNLPDENHVLLRVPRENNMWNVDLKNIVLLGDLTYLFAKAILDESNLWHRRLGYINFKTMNKLVKEDIKLLKLDVMLRDNALEELRKKFEKAKKERDELKLTLAKFQTSLKNLNESVPTSPVHDRYKSGEGYHAVPPPYTGAFMPLKPDLVFHDAYTISETVLTVFNVGPDESKGEPMPTQKVPSFVQTFKHVKNPRTSVQPVEHPTLAKNLRKYTPKSRGHRHSWNRKAGFVCNSLNHLIKDCDYYKKKMVQKHQALKDERVIDSGCSRHIIGSISYLSEFEEINGGYVAFGGNPKSGKIIGKDTECVVLSCDFNLPDENHVLLRVPRENNMWNVDLKNIVLLGDLTYLFAKAILDESNLWHRRLGYINFKTMNKLVKGNLVRGLSSKVFKNNHTCVACKKGKQHRASCKTKPVSSVSHLLQKLHMDLFGPTFVKSLNKKCYCLVVTDDYSRSPRKVYRKADEGFLVRYSVSSKAFRVFNSRTIIVQETLHINFLENQPNVTGNRPTWLFNIDTLTQFMNYKPVIAVNHPKSSACIQENLDTGKVGKESVSTQKYVLLPLWSTGLEDPQNTDADAAFNNQENQSEVYVSTSSSDKPKKHDEKVKREAKGKSHVELSTGVRDLCEEFEEFFVNITNRVNASSTPVTVVGANSTNNTNSFSAASLSNIAGHTQEEGIDYEEVFTPVARIEAKVVSSLCFFMGFMVYQMDVKSTFLYETIKEEVYMDDIIFGSTNKELCKAFKKLMKFHISSIGELSFFLGLQVKKKDDGIFISQDKYVTKILRKFGLTDGKSASTSIDTEKPLLKDLDGEDVDVHIYRSMIGSLMYLTSSRPDIMFAICACARFQNVVTTSSTEAEYVAVTSCCAQVLWIQNQLLDYGHFLNVVSYKLMFFGFTIDAGHVMLLDASEGFDQIVDFLNAHMIQYTLMVNPTIYVSCIKQFWTFVLIKKANDVMRLQALIDRKKVIISEDTIRQALLLDDAVGVDCLPNEDIFAELARMAYEKPLTKLTFYKEFLSAKWKFLIHTILQCMSAKRTAWNEFSSSTASAAIKDAAEDEDDDNEVSAKPTPPSPALATLPPSPTQEHIPSPPQAQIAQPSSPPPQQPSQTADIS